MQSNPLRIRGRVICGAGFHQFVGMASEGHTT